MTRPPLVVAIALAACTGPQPISLDSQAAVDAKHVFDRIGRVCDGVAIPEATLFDRARADHASVGCSLDESGDGWFCFEPHAPASFGAVELVRCKEELSGSRLRVRVVVARTAQALFDVELDLSAQRDAGARQAAVEQVVAAKLAHPEVTDDDCRRGYEHLHALATRAHAAVPLSDARFVQGCRAKASLEGLACLRATTQYAQLARCPS